MEDVQANNVEFVLKSVDDQNMIIQDPKEINDQCNLKTTGYLLDVTSNPIAAGSQDGQFVTADAICQDNQGTQFVTLEVENTDQIILQEKEVILWNDICRICANGSDRFIPIFTGDGLEHDLCTKIQTYLPLQVSEEDSLPHQICYNCAATLLAWHDIYKGCIDAQQRLIELQNKIKDQYYNESTIAEENNQAVLEVQTSNIEEPQIQAKDEEQNNPESEQVVNIAESERYVKEGDVITILTLPTTPSRKRKKGKLKSTSRSKKSSKPKEELTASQRRSELNKAKLVTDGLTYYRCNECSRCMTTPFNYFAHISTHTNERYCKCNLCGKGFTAPSSLTRHMRDVHAKIKEFKCNYCTRMLASKIARDEHERTHTNERPYVCEICNKTFRQRASLSVHKRFHSKVFVFKCKECNRGFPRKQDMERHELTHTDQKPYGCNLCSKKFRSSASAIRHKQTHNSATIMYYCNLCQDSFTQKRYLQAHMKKCILRIPKDNQDN